MVIGMVIYVDEFLLKNFFMEWLVLCLCGEILGIKYRIKDIAFACLVSTLLSFLVLINYMKDWVALKIIMIFLMVKLAYPQTSAKYTFIETGSIMIITFIMGGILEASISHPIERVLVGLIMLLAIIWYLNDYKKRKWKARNTYFLELEIEQQKIVLKGFLDTGNFMTFGIKREPVILVSCHSLEKLVSSDLFKKITRLEEKPFFKNRCLVFYCFADGTQKEQWGIRVKNMVISNQQVSLKKDVVILVSHQDFKEFDALIGFPVLEGGLDNGNDMDVSPKGSKIFC